MPDSPDSPSRTASRSLLPILRPKSVAVIGASDTPSRIGGRPIHSMKAMGYGGRIYPVNPRRETVQGIAAFPSIRDVPEPVDCALIAVPAAIAVDALRDCAETGVKSAVVFTSGFAEQGEDGERAQQAIAQIARDSGMRIVGPNCLGVFTLDEAWFGTFTNAPAMIDRPPGPAGIVSQSGAYGSHVLLVAQKRGVGANYWVTTGNECDVNVGEVIDFYAESPGVEIIVVYAEGIRDAARLRQALGKARDARKPVIFMKVGTTDVGARAAASHTASLAGSDAVYDALFRQYGVYRAGTTEELVDVAYACQYGSYPKGRRISLQTISGGVGVQMADDAVRYGLEVAPLPAPVQDKLKAMIPFAGTNNPVDFTAQALNEPDLMVTNIGLTIDEADYDSHVIFMTSVPSTPFMKEPCASLFRTVRERYPGEPMIMSLVGGRDVVEVYEKLGYPVYEDPSLAVRAMAALTRFGETFDRRGAQPAAGRAVRNAARARRGGGRARSHGDPGQRRYSGGAGEPDGDAGGGGRGGGGHLDGPCALKIVSPDILHKMEIGGVLAQCRRRSGSRRGCADPAAPGRGSRAGRADRRRAGVRNDQRRRRNRARHGARSGVRPGDHVRPGRRVRRSTERRQLPPRALRHRRGPSHDRRDPRPGDARRRARRAAGRSGCAGRRARPSLRLRRRQRRAAREHRHQPLHRPAQGRGGDRRADCAEGGVRAVSDPDAAMFRRLFEYLLRRKGPEYDLQGIQRTGHEGLATERLWLRPPAKADLPHFQRYALREAFYRYMDMEKPTPEGIGRYLRSAMATWRQARPTELVFAIEPDVAGRIAGLIRIRIGKNRDEGASVGFHLDSEFQGRGYAAEALREIVRIGFREPGIDRIWAEVDTRNTKSCRVLERAGFRKEKRMEGYRSVRGTVTDWYLYAVTAPRSG